MFEVGERGVDAEIVLIIKGSKFMSYYILTNDELKNILDRIIVFIENCDSKVSYLLSAFGVIFTILFTLKFPNLKFIECTLAQPSVSCLFILSLLGFVFSLMCFIKGLYHFTQVLIARTQCTHYQKSKLFFGHIATKYENYQEYLSDVNQITDDAYREDLSSQIYTNSQICNKKFEQYNIGFKFSIYSLPILIVTWTYLFQS